MAQFLPRLSGQWLPPAHYNVLLIDDDTTTARFVYNELRKHFRKSRMEATEIMLQVHYHGVAVAGTYPREIAEQKALMVKQDARRRGYPFNPMIEAIYNP